MNVREDAEMDTREDDQTGGGSSHRDRKTSTSASRHQKRNERRTGRERQLERKSERIHVEAGKYETEFKDCTAKALFKVGNLIGL